MNKNVRQLTECLRETFSSQFINEISKKTKFVQLESELAADKFLFLCTFYGVIVNKNSSKKGRFFPHLKNAKYWSCR
ncbi:hypothetical protein EZN00_00534 [Clostridium tyrobutyricum]|nr:hypothetical protein EZN00_00534 [Clostridium tyrobutyricum]